MVSLLGLHHRQLSFDPCSDWLHYRDGRIHIRVHADHVVCFGLHWFGRKHYLPSQWQLDDCIGLQSFGFCDMCNVACTRIYDQRRVHHPT